MIGQSIAAVALIILVLAAQAAVVARLRNQQPAVSRTRAAARSTAPETTTARRRPVNEPRPGDSAVVALLRRNPWLRRGLSTVSTAAIFVAVGLVGYPLYTNVYADRIQGRLVDELASGNLQQEYEACRLRRFGTPGCGIEEGDSLTRIVIPDIDVDVIVVEGTSPSALRAGAGHYVDTPLPCEDGNVSIAGHRTTYGRPFHDLDQLRERTETEQGSLIELHTPIGQCTYEVTDIRIVAPTEVSVIENTPNEDLLTLTTCHPKGSAAQRLVVRAELVGEPFAPPAAA